MQEKTLSNEKVNIKKLPSHYALGEYEKIFFPKWLYKFWPYQQFFLWTLFFISVFIYLFILALANGYKVNIKLFSKRSKIRPNVKEISDIAQIFPVGGIIIKTNARNSTIILKSFDNNKNYFKFKSGRFISVPVGKYDVKLSYPGKYSVAGKLVIGKELVYKDTFYLFNNDHKILASFSINTTGVNSKDITRHKSNLDNKIELNKNLFVANQGNRDIFTFIIEDNHKYFLAQIKYIKVFNKVYYDNTEITSLITRCKKLDSKFEPGNFYYWKQNLLFINKDKIFVANLPTNKIRLIKISGKEYNYLFKGNSLYIFKSFGNHIIKVSDAGVIIDKYYKQKGWFNIFSNTLYFWKVLNVTNTGTTLKIYKINKDLELVSIQNLFIPINNFLQIGFWNTDFIYIIQRTRFILYPLSESYARDLADFMLNNSYASFLDNYSSLNKNYHKFKLATFKDKITGKNSFYIYYFLSNNMLLKQMHKIDACGLLEASKTADISTQHVLVCFSDDFIIHAQRPNGVYYIENGNTKFLDGYSNVVLFTKQDNKNTYLFAKYLFIDSPDIKVNSFERKNYTILGVYKGVLIVFNKQENVLQIFKL